MAKRRRGSYRHRSGRVGAAAFEDLVTRALDSIPEPFARALQEVAIVIDDVPSREQLRESGLAPDDGLYGLYEGIPRTEYAADWAALPNKITLFQGYLLEDFPDPAELEREVQITVIHELAHHLGMSEERLHELGYE
jgi:predicted Zn-dependent protease with MMP-like domain